MDVEPAGFEDMFRLEYPGLVRVVAPIVGSATDAEAVVQEAFVKAYVRWRRVSRYDRPGAWIRRVAIRDAVRVANRQVPVAEADATDDGSVLDRIDVQRALLALPARQRACVVLHYFADWSVAYIATVLDCAESTVRVHLHRARQALADSEALQREDIDGR